MKRQLSTPRRILKIRETLRKAAIGRAMAADAQVQSLEKQSTNLNSLRLTMFENADCSAAQSLAARMELGNRLLGAGEQVERAVTDARQAAAEQDRQRIAAHLDRDVMQRFVERKAAGLEQQQDRRNAANLPFRRFRKPR
ncbi:hypothetical protein SAMN02745824_1147 [Parasphingorhabdus marina DSM 22363]|uniref:Flagellar FliJ protein n=1 Tax=Parasphingorhabdus marina DSM 22363 TaxID=1123272 RepID=A0A1N6CWP6_9SPHN|nr:hypothetical protein [Parasphingorhabdus marina]SIN62905.1 hypothetical protein SAMN02745824_1147 [Parasphingorhabdus marina DSM 22363]